jgi:hypothetical protein
MIIHDDTMLCHYTMVYPMIHFPHDIMVNPTINHLQYDHGKNHPLLRGDLGISARGAGIHQQLLTSKTSKLGNQKHHRVAPNTCVSWL